MGNIFVLFVRSLDARGDEYYIQHVEDHRLGTYLPAILNNGSILYREVEVLNFLASYLNLELLDKKNLSIKYQ